MNADRIVSIVVPTFNRFERLRRCIEAIRATDERPHEILIVDAGSTDGTREWLAEQADLRLIAEDRREDAQEKADPRPYHADHCRDFLRACLVFR